jgi:phosphatidylglycerol---prolipoprotein diacylglyceryl transferase
MLPYLSLGPLLLPMASLTLLLGVWLGSWLAEKEAAHLKIQADWVYNLIFIGLIAGLVGARLAYAARFIDAFQENPLGLLALNPATLSLREGLLVGLLAAWIYGRRQGLPLRPVLDALAPGLAGWMLFLGVAHLLSGDAYGAPSHLPWAVFQWSEYRHPAQLYEILLAMGILLVVRKRSLGEPGNGRNFWMVVALSAAARVFLEAFRGDSLIWSGGFRVAQVLGLILLAVSLWFLWAWGHQTQELPPSARPSPPPSQRSLDQEVDPD